MMMKATGTLATMVLISTILLQTDGSAIPMWEFLSRDEKMTHLYRIFDKLVKEYCEQSEMHDCYRNILLDGLQNLIYMDEYVLDTLDPYQRDAKHQIWRSLMGNKLFNNRIDESSKNFRDSNVDLLETGDSQDNGLAEESAQVNDYLSPSSYGGSYPSGPYIIRVYPDGRPVPISNIQQKPYDDDRDELLYYHRPSIFKIPTNNAHEQREDKLQTKVLPHKYSKGFSNNGINYDSMKSSMKFSRASRNFESK